MTTLDKLTQTKIENLVIESSDIYTKGNLEKSINLLKVAWEELPNSKYDYDYSYHIARHTTKILIELKAFAKASKWTEITSKCDPERADIGKKEFLIGQVAFESGQEQKAIEYFKIA